MTASLNEVTASCQKESEIAQKADSESKFTKELMSKLGVAADEIEHILKSIIDIANQTNLEEVGVTHGRPA